MKVELELEVEFSNAHTLTGYLGMRGGPGTADTCGSGNVSAKSGSCSQSFHSKPAVETIKNTLLFILITIWSENLCLSHFTFLISCSASIQTSLALF